jgi:hypothetical protein
MTPTKTLFFSLFACDAYRVECAVLNAGLLHRRAEQEQVATMQKKHIFLQTLGHKQMGRLVFPFLL